MEVLKDFVIGNVGGGSSDAFPKGNAKETKAIAGRLMEVDKLLSIGWDRGSKTDVIITCTS